MDSTNGLQTNVVIQSKVGFPAIHHIISFKEKKSIKELHFSEETFMMKHGFYFDPFFLLYPVRIDINTPAVIISNYQQSQIFIVRVQYIDLISFLTVTDASMQEEVPDFYGGKTNSNTKLTWLLVPTP